MATHISLLTSISLMHSARHHQQNPNMVRPSSKPQHREVSAPVRDQDPKMLRPLKEDLIDEFDFKISERLQEKTERRASPQIARKDPGKQPQRNGSVGRSEERRPPPAEEFESEATNQFGTRPIVYRPPTQDRYVRPPSVRITPILKEKYHHPVDVILYARSSAVRPRMADLEYTYPILKMMKEESNRPKPYLSKYSERFFFQALYHLIDYSRRTSALKFCYNCYSFRHRDSRKDQRFASRFMSDIFPYEDETEDLIRERWSSFLEHTIDYFLHVGICRPRGDGTYDFRLPSIGRCTSAHKENVTGMSCKFIYFYKDRVGKVPPENPNHSTHLPWGSPTTYITTSKAQRICRSSKLPSSRNGNQLMYHPSMRFGRLPQTGHPQYLGMGYMPRPLPHEAHYGHPGAEFMGAGLPPHYYMGPGFQHHPEWHQPNGGFMPDPNSHQFTNPGAQNPLESQQYGNPDQNQDDGKVVYQNPELNEQWARYQSQDQPQGELADDERRFEDQQDHEQHQDQDQEIEQSLPDTKEEYERRIDTLGKRNRDEDYQNQPEFDDEAQKPKKERYHSRHTQLTPEQRHEINTKIEEEEDSEDDIGLSQDSHSLEQEDATPTKEGPKLVPSNTQNQTKLRQPASSSSHLQNRAKTEEKPTSNYSQPAGGASRGK